MLKFKNIITDEILDAKELSLIGLRLDSDLHDIKICIDSETEEPILFVTYGSVWKKYEFDSIFPNWMLE